MSPSIPTRVVSALPPGTAAARYLICKGAHPRDIMSARAAAEGLRDTPLVGAALHLKSSVGPYSTLLDGFALSGIGAEALTVIRGLEIVGRLPLRRVPLYTAVPRQTGDGAAGGFVGEGQAVPVSRFAFDELTLRPTKHETLTLASRELLKLDPQNEKTITAIILSAAAASLDLAFLDPARPVTAWAPASITSAATVISSTGGTAPTAAQLVADLGAMIGAISTSGAGLRWVLRPTTAARLALVLGAAAADLPRSLLGIPAVVSGNSPAQIALIDCSAVCYGEDDTAFTLDTALHASIQASDAPTNAGLTDSSPADVPIATTLLSLWENNLVGLKAERFVNWEPTAPNFASVMSVSY